jgi:DNA-binding MarR family transcriptional regulator
MTYANDMPTTTDPALASSLRMSVMRLARRLRAERADTSLSISQLAAMATLERHGALGPGELAAHEKVSAPSMTRLTGHLESAGLVARAPHPTDRRQVVLRLTPQGQAVLKEDRRRRDAWLSQQLRDLDADDLTVLRAAAAVLDRLASA